MFPLCLQHLFCDKHGHTWNPTQSDESRHILFPLFSLNPSTAKSFSPDNGSVCSRDQGLKWEHPSSPLHAACGWDAPWMLCLSVVHWCVGVLVCYFVAKWYFTVQLHHNPPIHWWNSGHSKFEALMNEAAINIHVKVSRWTYVSISLE